MSAESRPSRVLIVDDDFATRLLAEEALLPSGLEVICAGDGAEALAQFDARQPDVVLLDINMPGIDGYEVCRRIRQRPRGAATPLMVMTASDDVDSVEEAFRAGATDFITKPLNLVLLGHRVRYLLRASQAFLDARESAKRLAHTQRLARLACWHIVDGRFEWSHDSLEALGPAAPAELTAGGLTNLVHPEDRARVTDALASAAPHQIDFRLQLPDGSERLVHQEAELAGEDGVLIGATQDVTEMRRAEEQITQLAFFDDLTGLANRAFVHRFLRRAVTEARKHRHQLAVLAVDLDLFRQVNDTFGPAIGDTLLREAGARISRCTRDGHATFGIDSAPTDPDTFNGNAIVARLGGDEFVVVQGKIFHADQVAVTAARIHEALAERFVLGDSEVLLTASVGIATFPDVGEDPRTLLERADAALSHAKRSGRNAVQHFSESIQQELYDRAELERRLRGAVARLPPPGAPAGEGDMAEFELYYQPKVDTETGMLTGVEALLRWHPLDRMPIAPDVFIPVAEETGLIVPLGRWVLREACLQAQRWRREGTPLRVSVNVSARQFREAFFPQQVAEVLAETGFEPSMLELELTEHLMMSDNEYSARVLRELKALGVEIALDDFGVGYSSLSYLSRLPIDTLKIDRSFVSQLSHERSSETIIAAIIALSKSLGLRVVAEGVETAEELELLTRHGACEVQGYYFARPMPPDDLMREMLEQGRVAPPVEVDDTMVA